MQRFDIYCIVIVAFVFIAFPSVVKMYADLMKKYVHLVNWLQYENRELIRRADNLHTASLDGIIAVNDSLIGLVSELSGSGEVSVEIDDDNPELWNIKQQVD